jgi:hypothetical protein
VAGRTGAEADLESELVMSHLSSRVEIAAPCLYRDSFDKGGRPNP